MNRWMDVNLVTLSFQQLPQVTHHGRQVAGPKVALSNDTSHTNTPLCRVGSNRRKQRLVFSILEFLSDELSNGGLKQEDKEGIEVASGWLIHSPS